jgi:hypothetical protein
MLTAEAEESGSAHAHQALGFTEGIGFLDEGARCSVDVREGERELSLHPTV